MGGQEGAEGAGAGGGAEGGGAEGGGAEGGGAGRCGRERERACGMLAGLRRINHLKISEDLRSLEK